MSSFVSMSLIAWVWWGQGTDFGQHINISKDEYKQRRQALLEKIPDHPMVIMGNVLRNRINDTDYEFRQESNFYYLTGFNEPNAFLVLSKQPFEFEGKMVQELLFVPENNPQSMTWTGKRMGVEGAKTELGLEAVTQSYSSPFSRSFGEKFEAFMRDFVSRHTSFYLLTPIIHANLFEKQQSFEKAYAESMVEKLSQIVQTPADKEQGKKIEILPSGPLREALSSLREVKSPAEIAMLQRAVDITLSGHEASWKMAKHAHFEYQMEAAVEFAFKYNGAAAVGYNSIVGCGPNGTILHYDTNRDPFDAAQMFCLDAGAEYRNYTADITRSFPADGSFTKEQRAIYNLVLEGQRAGAAAFVEGSNYLVVQAAIDKVMNAGLESLGLIEKVLPEIMSITDLKSKGFLVGNYFLAEDVALPGGVSLGEGSRLFPWLFSMLDGVPGGQLKVFHRRQYRQITVHGWGHSVGLDVHDPVSSQTFRSGMIWTIEPGIYLSDRLDFPIPDAYKNIGVRIEDMYLIKPDGSNECLSAGLPREVEAIEAMLKEKSTNWLKP